MSLSLTTLALISNINKNLNKFNSREAAAGSVTINLVDVYGKSPCKSTPAGMTASQVAHLAADQIFDGRTIECFHGVTSQGHAFGLEWRGPSGWTLGVLYGDRILSTSSSSYGDLLAIVLD